MWIARAAAVSAAVSSALLMSAIAIIDPFAFTTAIGWWVLPLGLLMAGGDAMRQSLPRPVKFGGIYIANQT